MSESGTIGTYGTSLGGLVRGVEFCADVTIAGNYWPYDCDGILFIPQYGNCDEDCVRTHENLFYARDILVESVLERISCESHVMILFHKRVWEVSCWFSGYILLSWQ